MATNLRPEAEVKTEHLPAGKDRQEAGGRQEAAKRQTHLADIGPASPDHQHTERGERSQQRAQRQTERHPGDPQPGTQQPGQFHIAQSHPFSMPHQPVRPAQQQQRARAGERSGKAALECRPVGDGKGRAPQQRQRRRKLGQGGRLHKPQRRARQGEGVREQKGFRIHHQQPQQQKAEDCRGGKRAWGRETHGSQRKQEAETGLDQGVARRDGFPAGAAAPSQ